MNTRTNCVPCAIHEDAVKTALSKMPKSELFEQMITFYQLISDETRCRILFVLDNREMCVSDIAFALGESRSLISHQLRVLKDNRAVVSRRDGKHIYYTLCDDHIRLIFEAGLEHASEEKT